MSDATTALVLHDAAGILDALVTSADAVAKCDNCGKDLRGETTWNICTAPAPPPSVTGLPKHHAGHTACTECAENPLSYAAEGGACRVCLEQLGGLRSQVARAGVAMRPPVKNCMATQILRCHDEAKKSMEDALEAQDAARRQEGVERRKEAVDEKHRKAEERARAELEEVQRVAEETRRKAETEAEETRRKAEAEAEAMRREAEAEKARVAEEARRATEEARRAAEAERAEEVRRAAEARRAADADAEAARRAADAEAEAARRAADAEAEAARQYVHVEAHPTAAVARAPKKSRAKLDVDNAKAAKRRETLKRKADECEMYAKRNEVLTRQLDKVCTIAKKWVADGDLESMEEDILAVLAEEEEEEEDDDDDGE